MKHAYKDFVDFVEEVYYCSRNSENYEQDFFNRIKEEYTTQEYKPVMHIFNHVDDKDGDVAEAILNELMYKTLVRAVCFDDEELDRTIYVALIKE